MTLRSLTNLTLSIALLGASSLLAGCGNDCKDACDKSNSCSGAKAQDCDTYCDKAEQLASDAGCDSEYDDVTSCVSDLDDVCSQSALASCASQSKAYSTCITKYCATH